MFAGTEGGAVYMWDLNSDKSTVLAGHKSKITSIAYEEMNQIIATSSEDSTVKIWDLRTAKSTFTYTGHTDSVNDVAISPDGKWVASAGKGQHVKIWEIDTGKQIK